MARLPTKTERHDKAAIAVELRATFWPLIDSGATRPRIAATFPPAPVADAHRLMESSQLIGEIVLEAAEKPS